MGLDLEKHPNFVFEISHSLQLKPKMEKKSVETEGDDDEPITEQELEIVEAIEAAYELSITRKRQLSPPVHNNHTHRPMSITSRRLPSSLVASPSSPSFSLSHCQGPIYFLAFAHSGFSFAYLLVGFLFLYFE